MKPICVKCERFYRPKANGTPFVEMMPTGGSERAEPGTSDRDSWTPYKLWMADLWECHGCGHELIVGAGRDPLAEHYQSDFAAKMEAVGATIIVNDC
jgi:hypothetical protein